MLKYESVQAHAANENVTINMRVKIHKSQQHEHEHEYKWVLTSQVMKTDNANNCTYFFQNAVNTLHP